MKTCTSCGETYSERIDFCFNDGAVLVLMPSALDAPVPRLVSTPTEGTAGRLRTDLTEETAPDATDEMHTPAFPAHAGEAPPPPRRRDEEANAVVLAAAVSGTSPASQAIPVAASAGPTEGIGALPKIGDASKTATPGGAVAWFSLAAGMAVVVVLLLWIAGVVSPGTEVRLPPVEAQNAQIEAPPTTPAEPPPAPASPEPVAPPAPAVAPAHPTTPPPATNAAAPRRTTPAPSRAPASTSPWDAPSAVEDATATFTSDPVGAVVRIDGRLRGKTPLDVKLMPGSHDIEIALDGYITSARTLNIAPGSPKIPVTLHPAVRQGNVLVVAAGWDGALLYVDGSPAGPLPVQVMMSQGNHTFEVRRNGEKARVQRAITLNDRGLTKLNLTF